MELTQDIQSLCAREDRERGLEFEGFRIAVKIGQL